MREAQEEGKNFYYAWLVLLIVLIDWRTPTEAQFLDIEPNPCAATRYATVWNSEVLIAKMVDWVLRRAGLSCLCLFHSLREPSQVSCVRFIHQICNT